MPIAVVLSGNVTVTVDPGSALPIICVSSLVTSFIVGASGAVVSLTVVLTGSVSLPVSSVDITCNSSPPSKSTSFGIAIIYFPVSSVSPVATSPFGNVIVTVDPGSAVPLIFVS